MSELYVNTDEMIRQAAQLKKIADRVGEIKRKLDKLGASGTDGVTGACRDAFVSQKVRMEQEYIKLMNLQRILKEAAEEYLAAFIRAEQTKPEHLNYYRGNKMDCEAVKEIEQRVADEVKGAQKEYIQLSGDPVNMSTGSFVYQKTDLVIPGHPLMAMRRFYNAIDRRSGGILGKGWYHLYGVCLYPEQEGATLVLEDGREAFFRKMGDRYEAEGITGTLKRTEKGYTYRTLDRTEYVFDEFGTYVRQMEEDGGTLELEYSETGQLKRVVRHPDKAVLEFHYDGFRFTGVSDHSGRKAEFRFDEKKHLCEAVNAAGEKFCYEYDKEGRISRIRNPYGIVPVQNHYDGKGRVVDQHLQDDGTFRIEYDDYEKTACATERDGSQSLYCHNEYYQNILTVHPDGSREQWEYNRMGQIIRYTDAEGNITRYSYDARGYLTLKMEPDGRRYSATYDADGHLIAENVNGRCIRKNRYDAQGRLTEQTDAEENRTIFTYKKGTRPEKITYADGSSLHMEYDEKGNLIALEDGAGNREEYSYDELNRLVLRADPLGRKTEYTYDAMNRIESVTNPMGDRRIFSYDLVGKVTEIRDFDGYSLHCAYNILGRPESETDKEGNTIRYGYDRMWNLDYVQYPDSAEERCERDERERPVSVIQANGGKRQYIYDRNGNCIKEKDAEGGEINREFDACGRICAVTDAEGMRIAYRYDEYGNLVEIVDAFGNRKIYAYDKNGHCIKSTDVHGNCTEYTYDAVGRVSRICYPNGGSETFTYCNGRLASYRAMNGGKTCYTYDAVGNVVRMEREGVTECYTYDALNRMISRQTGENPPRTWEYDRVGNMTAQTDENGNRTEYTYSPNGNLKSVRDALGAETGYEYDSCGRLIRVRRKDASGAEESSRCTDYEYTLSGQVAGMTDALGNRETFHYDRNGNLIRHTDRDGNKIDFWYGKCGELAGVHCGDGREIRYEYDMLHVLQCFRDWTGATHILTDKAGRPDVVTNPRGECICYSRGSMEEIQKLVYPDERKVCYAYNTLGQLIRMQEKLPDGRMGVENIYMYDKVGRLSEKCINGTICTSYSYNDTGRIAGIRHSGPGIQEEYRYRYDAVGNRTESVENGEEYHYHYDALNRLTGVEKNGKPLRRYSYDAYGNRIRKVEYTEEDVKETRYTYDRNDRLTRMDGPNGQFTYSYDRRGNLIEKYKGKMCIQRYGYDAAGHLCYAEQRENGETERTEYICNGMGQRVEQKTTDRSGTKQLCYTPDLTRAYHNLLTAFDDRGNRQDYLWDGMVTATVGTEGKGILLQDMLGSPTILAKPEGKEMERYGYDEFGIPEGRPRNSLLQPFGYTGYRMDETVGLWYAQAREYDAWSGRFVSEDYVRGFIDRPYTLNHYSYCWNRPLDYVDLDGELPTFVIGAAIGAVVGGAGSIISDAVSGKEIDWDKAGRNTVKGAVTGAVIGSGAGLVGSIAGEAAVSGYLATTAVNAAVSGAVNSMTNEGDKYSNFVNGVVGGAVANTVSYTTGKWIDENFPEEKIADIILKKALINGFNGVGGVSGSVTTDGLNNWDKKADGKTQKRVGRILIDAGISGGATILMGLAGQNALTPFDNPYKVGIGANSFIGSVYGTYAITANGLTYAGASCIGGEEDGTK